MSFARPGITTINLRTIALSFFRFRPPRSLGLDSFFLASRYAARDSKSSAPEEDWDVPPFTLAIKASRRTLVPIDPGGRRIRVAAATIFKCPCAPAKPSDLSARGRGAFCKRLGQGPAQLLRDSVLRRQRSNLPPPPRIRRRGRVHCLRRAHPPERARRAVINIARSIGRAIIAQRAKNFPRRIHFHRKVTAQFRTCVCCNRVHLMGQYGRQLRHVAP